ncbi:MAG: rod shape-determining protein MreC [Candidatus Omnitrophota bacterium]|nr:rod shape-determining protein MreC [Candidatus Omnitrophota bacterium]
MNKPRITIVAALITVFIWAMFAPPQILLDFKTNMADIAGLPLKTTTGFFNYANKISRLSYVNSGKLELKQKIHGFERKLAELREVSLENERLRGLLGFREATGKSSIPALVIGRDPNNWNSVIIIDKGLDDGIVKDMIVASSRGLVGRIKEPAKKVSKVMLINDTASKIGAFLQESREHGLLVGAPDGKCRVIYLSLDADINKGDKVLTSGMGGAYPKGIVIGEVAKIAKEKGRLYKYAIVKPSSELTKLEEVLCIIK